MANNNENYKSYSTSLALKTVLIYVVSIFLVVLAIFPFWIMVVNATRTSDEIRTGMSLIPGGNFLGNLEALNSRNLFFVWRGLKNSMIIAGGATILSIFFSALTAYGIHVYSFKLKNVAFTFILVVLMIPTQVSAIGFLNFMYDLNLNNTFIPLIIPAIAAPQTVFFIRQNMRASFSMEIIEAARIDGSREFGTFLKIGLPMLKPVLAVQAIFTFIASWNNYFTPKMILSSPEKDTLPMMVAKLNSDRLKTDFGAIYVGTSLSILPMVIVYICLSKYIVGGVALGGVKE